MEYISLMEPIETPSEMVDDFYAIINNSDVHAFITKFNQNPKPGLIMSRFDYFLDHIIGIGDLPTMKILVENFSFDVRYKNNLAIRICAGTNHNEMMKYFIQQGANVNPYPPNSQFSLLGKVLSINPSYSMLKLLFDSGADANSGCGSVFACVCGMTIELVKLFIENGADVKNNEQAFINAVDFQRLDIVQLLIDHGADVRMQNNAVIKLAHEKNNPELIKLLVKNSVSIQ